MSRERVGDHGDVNEPGATMDLPHDRLTIERFRLAFPRARWSERKGAWFVPGTTANRRISRWLAELEAEADSFADEKGRDAFAFDPIVSPYLEAAPSALLIRTPYSKTVISEIREIRDARWDADRRLWTVPYRSLEDLRRHWPKIESLAARSEPSAKKARREALRGTDIEKLEKARSRERRRKRYPVPIDQIPPFDHAVATQVGIVMFTHSDGELAEPALMETLYFQPAARTDYVWAAWRRGTVAELVSTWPAATGPSDDTRQRGWWKPTLDELRIARREARSREKARRKKPDTCGE